MQVREVGVIKKFVVEKGFGFIARDGCRDLFFHISEFSGDADTIQPGLRVEFDVETDSRGRLHAVDARMVVADGSDAGR